MAFAEEGLRQSTITTTRTSRLQRPWLLVWLSTVPVALLRASQLAESDTFWQIRTGLWTVAHRAIPHSDPFSWTVRGKPWTLNSWGFNVLLAALYRLGGLPVAALGAAAVVAGIFAIAVRLARGLGASPLPTGLFLLAGSPLLIAYLAARPGLADYAGTLALLGLLGWRGGWRVVWLLPLCAVWVNLHAGAVLAIPIVVAYGAFAVARSRSRLATVECVALLASAMLGVLLNPYGFGIFGQTIAVRDASTAYVVEWQHANLTSPVQATTLALGTVALWAAWRRRDAVFAPALAVLVVGSVVAVRVQPILVLAALPLLAAAASRSPYMNGYIYSRRRVWQLALVPLVALAIVGLTHVGRPDRSTYPSAPVLASLPRDCHALTSYSNGGYVTLERPDVLVSIDSRNDLYGGRALRRYESMMEGRGSLEGANCALIPPTSELANRLEHEGWQRIAIDKAAVALIPQD